MSRRPTKAPPQNNKARPAVRREARNATRRQRLRLLAGGAGVLIVALIIGVFIVPRINSAQPTPNVPGSVTYCNTTQPLFAQKLGFGRNAVLDTRSQDVKGMILYDFDQNGNPTRSFSDPSWSSAGFLGPPVLDGLGNIYVAPIPAINVLDNPPAAANIIYRIDSSTGKMSELLNLPTAAAPTPDNAYGVVGLTYDCDTNSLYVSSVFGSDRLTQAGRLFRVDPNKNRVGSMLDGIDAFGVAVFNSAQGKRLYFGLARTPAIDSIQIDSQGNFVGTIHNELTLSGLGFHGDKRAHEIRFSGKDTMVVKTIQFDFNLVAPTETRQTTLQYRYDQTQDTWQLISSTPVNS